MFAGVFGEDVAVLAALVTCIGDVPLKREILFHRLCPRFYSKSDGPSEISCVPGRQLPAGNGCDGDRTDYLSPAPQAEPQAVGFSSGLSPAPQAVPQAAGFSSGLSPAPQAVPQAAAGAVSSFLFHPKRFDSAMMLTSRFGFKGLFRSLCFHYGRDSAPSQVRTFLLPGHLFVTSCKGKIPPL